MEQCIEVNGISKKYGNRFVVNDLHFSVKKGTVFGLLGHNGAGKSTLIDCILGLCKPDKGVAFVFGQQVAKHRKQLFENIGVQLQDSHFQDNIKVYEVCEVMSCLYANPQDYKKLLEQFGMLSFLKAKVDDLSGGERQKLSVLLTLIPSPQLIFLDELTTGLDVAARREVWTILKKLKEEGLTIFLTTHYMEEAENLCDDVLLMKEGVEIVSGSLQEVIAKTPYDNLEEAYLYYMEENK